VRNNLFGRSEATYSGYTCYTGIADFIPADIESVGYVAVSLNLMHIFSDYESFSDIGSVSFSLKATGFSWDTNSTLFLRMLVVEKCNGMHFTRNQLVGLMLQMVNFCIVLLLSMDRI